MDALVDRNISHRLTKVTIKKTKVDFLEVYNTIKEMNIADEKSMSFKSACIIWWALHNGTWDVDKITWATGYKKKKVDLVIDNLKNNGLLSDGKLVMSEEEENLWMEFILIAMAGAGEIRRYDADKESLQNVTQVQEVQNNVAPDTVGKPAEDLDPEINVEEWLYALYKDVKAEDIYPLPNTYVRILVNDEKNWVRPIKVDGSLITGIVQSLMSKYYEQGEKIQFSYLSIISIQGKSKSKVLEIKQMFNSGQKDERIVTQQGML